MGIRARYSAVNGTLTDVYNNRGTHNQHGATIRFVNRATRQPVVLPYVTM